MSATLGIPLALTALLAVGAAASGRGETILVSGRVVDLAPPDLGPPESVVPSDVLPADVPPAAPAAGLALELEIRSGTGGSTLPLTTDEQGRFRLELDDPGERPLAIEVRAPGDEERRPALARTTLGPGVRTAFDLSLERAVHGALEGCVVDPWGRPLGGALVRGAPPDETQAEPPSLPASPSAGTPIGAAALDSAAALRSDADGRFRIPSLRAAHPLRAELEAHASPAALVPEARPEGGWSPLRLVLQPVGRLAVRIASAAGVGQPELELAIVPRDPAVVPLERWNGTRAWMWTDTEGQAVFEGVWAGTPLDVVVYGPDGEEWRLPHRVGPLLVAESDPAGRAIELGAAESLALELRLGPELIVRGQVLNAEGEPPLGRLFVQAKEVDPPGGGLSPTSQLQRRVEADGSFELRLLRAPQLGRLFVSVGLGLDPTRGTLAHEVVDPGRIAQGALELSFVAAGRPSIRGRVPGLGQDAPEFSVRALPAGLSRLQSEELLGNERRMSVEFDGTFEFLDLPRGLYDLVVEERSACFGAIARRFPGIAAGSAGLELALRDEREVRIRVRGIAPEGDVASMVVLAGRSFPRLDLPLPAGPPATSRHFGRAASWPPSAAPVPGRVQTVADASAITSCMTFAVVGETLTLPPVEAGWYVLGVYARDERGEAYAPVATEPIALGAGFHEFSFDLCRTTRLTGRLSGGEPDRWEELRVTLMDERDRPVALRKSMSSFTDRVRPKRDGSFSLHEVPLGEHRLWVGTDEELDARRFRCELLVDVRGDDAELLIELP